MNGWEPALPAERRLQHRQLGGIDRSRTPGSSSIVSSPMLARGSHSMAPKLAAVHGGLPLTHAGDAASPRAHSNHTPDDPERSPEPMRPEARIVAVRRTTPA
jgi:hypothetical protein